MVISGVAVLRAAPLNLPFGGGGVLFWSAVSLNGFFLFKGILMDSGSIDNRLHKCSSDILSGPNETRTVAHAALPEVAVIKLRCGKGGCERVCISFSCPRRSNLLHSVVLSVPRGL